MKKNKINKGVWTALVTPFLPGEWNIDWESFEKLLDQQIAAGIDGVVVCGTTGEATSLSLQEKLAIIRKAKASIGDRVQIMAGVGTSNTDQTLEMGNLAIEAGANSLLVVTPPYVKPSLNGLICHFKKIADKTCAPICLYHVPGRTGQMLSVESLFKLCEECGIDAIKEASGNLHFFAQITAKCPHTSIFSGDDFTYLPSLALGASGVISVISNLFPHEMVELTKKACEEDYATARKYHYALLPALESLFCETSPGPLKAALAMTKRCHNELRLPLAPVEQASYIKIQAALLETSASLSKLR